MLSPESVNVPRIVPVEVPCKSQLFIVSDVTDPAVEMADIKLPPDTLVKNDGVL